MFTFLACIGCGGPEALEEVPIAEWACMHATEGELIDVSTARLEATEIEIGRVSHRVNVHPQQPGFLGFTLEEDVELVLLTDDPSAVTAIWTVVGRTEIEVIELEPSCADIDLFEVDLALEAGEYTLEVGPTRQANVWISVGWP